MTRTQDHDAHDEREDNEDREHRDHLTPDAGWRQKIAEGAGHCGPGHQEEHGSCLRIAGDKDRDNGGQTTRNVGPAGAGEGLVVEKVHPKAANVAVTAVCQASDSEKSTRVARTAPAVV